MNSKIEIFDKDGKALHIASVISRFFEEKSEEHKLPVAEMAIYYEANSLELSRIDTEDYAHQSTLEECNPNGL